MLAQGMGGATLFLNSALWPFRLGKNPFRKQPQKIAAASEK
jgi:hypothetical protein